MKVFSVVLQYSPSREVNNSGFINAFTGSDEWFNRSFNVKLRGLGLFSFFVNPSRDLWFWTGRQNNQYVFVSPDFTSEAVVLGRRLVLDEERCPIINCVSIDELFKLDATFGSLEY